jgi:hypothetical protein
MTTASTRKRPRRSTDKSAPRPKPSPLPEQHLVDADAAATELETLENRIRDAEAAIEKNTLQQGEDLLRIRDGRRWEAEFKSFADYVNARLPFGASRARQLVAAFISTRVTRVTPEATNEKEARRQARAARGASSGNEAVAAIVAKATRRTLRKSDLPHGSNARVTRINDLLAVITNNPTHTLAGSITHNAGSLNNDEATLLIAAIRERQQREIQEIRERQQRQTTETRDDCRAAITATRDATKP